MDDFDDERFSHPALSPAPAARHGRWSAPVVQETGPPSVEGNREHQLLGPPKCPHAVRVRGLVQEERERIQEELQLLAALEVAGVTAAPAVLELEDEGFVRETGPALTHQEGRRAAETSSPPTGERRALARARDALDELIDALHERGWVLGAPPGHGLGARPDGSVLVDDLRGLRREDSLSARQDDRRWVDSVLQDPDRTLRRRVHLERSRADGDELVLGGMIPAEEPRPVTAPGQEIPVAVEPSSLPVPRRQRRSRTDPQPIPDAIDRRGQQRPQGTPEGAGSGDGLLSSVREVLRQPRLRRTAVLSGAVVLLLCGTLVGVGAWWTQGRGAVSSAGNPSAAAAPSEVAPLPAPRIEDPRMLVAELAGARHAYVTGISELPVSAEGSTALAEDERLRDAYEGITVTGGGPVVHSAEVIEGPGEGGDAVLRAVTSMEDLQLEGADGGITAVPGTDRVTVRLILHWDGQDWRIVSAEQLGTAEKGGTS